jgi:hypothetical protein
MGLRKLLTLLHFQRAKGPEGPSLRDWLLGTGVAVACLAPVGPALSLSGGDGEGQIAPCISAAPQLCTDGSGNACDWYDGQGLHMQHACVVQTLGGPPQGHVLFGTKAACPSGCNANGALGNDCSANSSCYY